MSKLQERIYFTDEKKDRKKPKRKQKKRNEAQALKNDDPQVPKEERIVKRYLKSEAGLSDDELTFLTRQENNLIDADISLEQDHYVLDFDLSDMDPLTSAGKMMLHEKCSILYNAGNLESCCDEYTFSMDPSNLYLTSGLSVRVLERQIKTKEDSFTEKYKALIGAIIQPEYFYYDYLNGGKDLFAQNDILGRISAAGTTAEIQSILSKIRTEEIENNSAKFEYVEKKRIRLLKRLVPIMAILMIAGFAAGGYSFFVKGAMDDTVIEANNMYIRSDYRSVLKAIKDIDISKLPRETQYISARSAVLNENISDEQKNNILDAMNVNTNDKVFEFWICIGTDRPAEALEVAKSLNSLELQYYAIASYIRMVEKDGDMSGSKKEKLLGELNQQREEWEKQLNEAYNRQTEEEQAAAEAAMEKVQEENNTNDGNQ